MSVAASTPPSAQALPSRAISEAIEAKLATSSYPAMRGIRYDHEAGMIALRGTLPSYYAIQMAISLAQIHAKGRVLVRNCLQVVSEGSA